MTPGRGYAPGMRFALLLAVACTGLEAPPTAPCADSAEPEPFSSEPQPGLSEQGVLTCADPSARDALGPIYEADLGPDWAAQVPLTGVDPEPGAGLVVEDFTGDGVLDVFVTGYTPCQLFVGDGRGGLVDESDPRLPAPALNCQTYGASAADFDQDGDLDLFLAKNGAADRLWVNDGDGHFFLRSGGVGLTPHACGSRNGSWGDMDGDGDLDLFVGRHHVVHGASSDGCPVLPPLPGRAIRAGDANSLYENLGDGTFADVTDRLGDMATYGYTFQGGWVDLNGDGNLDLYVINDYGSSSEPCFPLLGDGTGHFTPASEDTGLYLRIDGMALSVADVNLDGLPDLAITDIDRLHLLLSDGMGGWFDAAASYGIAPSGLLGQRASWGVELADLDNDADLDFVTVYGPTEGLLLDEDTTPEQPDALFLQGDDGRFEDVAGPWGWADTGVGRGLVVVDYNRDGWLDLFKMNYRRGPAQAYLSRCGSAHWLSVRLEGTTGVHPWGAKVEVDVGEETHTRWLMPTGSSMASSGPPDLHFGLGPADHVDAMRVTWADGTVSAFSAFATSQFVTVSYEDSAPTPGR